MTTREWQRRRAEFNHDWLKNQYLQDLGRWNRLLADEIDDPRFERRFVAEVLPTWEKQERVVTALVREFEGEMSPRVLFERSPLSDCNSSTQNWLPDLMHSLWLARYPVRAWLSNARRILEDACIAYSTLCSNLATYPDRRSVEKLRPLRPDFERFRSACHDLASAIEKFPDRILVV
jgi:hypothetical protein